MHVLHIYKNIYIYNTKDIIKQNNHLTKLERNQNITNKKKKDIKIQLTKEIKYVCNYNKKFKKTNYVTIKYEGFQISTRNDATANTQTSETYI